MKRTSAKYNVMPFQHVLLKAKCHQYHYWNLDVLRQEYTVQIQIFVIIKCVVENSVNQESLYHERLRTLTA